MAISTSSWFFHLSCMSCVLCLLVAFYGIVRFALLRVCGAIILRWDNANLTCPLRNVFASSTTLIEAFATIIWTLKGEQHDLTHYFCNLHCVFCFKALGYKYMEHHGFWCGTSLDQSYGVHHFHLVSHLNLFGKMASFGTSLCSTKSLRTLPWIGRLFTP